MNKDFDIIRGILVRYKGHSDVAEIPSDVDTIGAEAFRANEYIKKIIIPSSVKVIERAAFGGCWHLEEIVFSEGLETIGENAFSYCYNIKELSLPNSVKAIKKHAFAKCSALKQITLPATLSLKEPIVLPFEDVKVLWRKVVPLVPESDRKIIERKKVGGKEGSASNDFVKKAQEFKIAYDAKVKLVADLQKQLAKLEKENKELSATVKSQGDTISALTAELEEVSRILSE